MVVVVPAQSNTTVLSREDYLNKSKKLKSTGTVLVAAGLTATVVGFVISSTTGKTDDPLSSLDKLPGQTLAALGIATALCSIPFYIKAGKYDRKAAAISFGNRKIISPFQTGFIATSQPTISLNIKF